ncbi:hypothetical protein RE0356_07430 [Prescottella equi]|nr:hypothetical protein RE0356_07430 [Prescottella equi]
MVAAVLTSVLPDDPQPAANPTANTLKQILEAPIAGTLRTRRDARGRTAVLR